MRPSSAPAEKPVLKRDDIHTGLSLVQTIYGIAMVLGLQGAIETSYNRFVSPVSSPAGRTFSAYVVLFALGAITLLGLRFFWVPRNLYAYLLESKLSLTERARMVTILHFPITLIHALLFYCICQAYVDIANSSVGLGSGLAHALASRFAVFYIGLLVLNGFWLRGIGWRKDNAKAENIWSRNNLICGALALGVFVAFKAWGFSTIVFMLSVSLVFVVNSAIDLWTASEHYILFPDVEIEPARESMRRR